MPAPTFSLIMPAYNARQTIRESLDCIRDQRFGDFEVLIVDDGSTDDTRQIAQEYADADPRFKVLPKPNGGVASVYNHAIPLVAGRFVVIAPSDDLLYPEHLATMALATAEHSEFDIFCCNGERLLDTGERARTYTDAAHATAHEVELLDVIAASFFAVGVTYRKSLFDALGGYREDIYGEDWDFWLRAMKEQGARVWYVPQVLAGNRIRAENKSSDLQKVFSTDIEILEGFARNHDLTHEERQAVDASIEFRHSLLDKLAREASGPGRAKAKLRSELMRVFGTERVERAVARLKRGGGQQ